ncbi:MAG: hypothetical protein E6R04_04120 [Spirochaetes bacterium]|nr:MAG: hypothetical protein E6R04_04120 [Spirochaetota bacterium]
MTSLSEMKNIIKRAVRTGTNVHFSGNPGIGKTSIIEQTVQDIQQKDKDFKLWILYTPAMSPLDFTAVVPDLKTRQLLTMYNTRLPNAFDCPDQRGIVFLGEFWNADQDTNKCLQKYLNNEDMGGFMKPKNVIVISDSNDIAHHSGVVSQSLALLSRSRSVTVFCDVKTTMPHFEDIGVVSSVVSFLTARPDLIDNFEQLLSTNTRTQWANPRSWVRLSNAIKDAEAHDEELTEDEIIGDIGEAVGREFIGFVRAMKTLVKYTDIVANPEQAEIPGAVSDRYAVMAMLAESVQFKEATSVFSYVDRYDQELQVLFMRLLYKGRNPDMKKITESEKFVGWIKSKPELIEIISKRA